MRKLVLSSIVAAALLAAGCGQYAGVRAEARSLRRFGAVGPALAPGAVSRARPGARASNATPAPVPSAAPAAVDADLVTWPQWAALLLPRVGAPVCDNNVVAVVAWAAQEGTAAGWNPLATTHEMPGSTRFNSHGVQNYVSLEQGLDATIRTIENGLVPHGYGGIVAELQRCAPPMATARAIKASAWCAGCAEGRYVTGIVRLIRAGVRAAG